jgi:phage terminase Nu1 subunit (DNA packaging protein)
MSEIDDAIANAASADNESQTPVLMRRGFSNVSMRRLAMARQIIRRFLEDVPDGATVLELREAIDGGEGSVT